MGTEEPERVAEVRRLRHLATSKLVMLRAMADYEEAVIRWCDNEVA